MRPAPEGSSATRKPSRSTQSAASRSRAAGDVQAPCSGWPAKARLLVSSQASSSRPGTKGRVTSGRAVGPDRGRERQGHPHLEQVALGGEAGGRAGRRRRSGAEWPRGGRPPALAAPASSTARRTRASNTGRRAAGRGRPRRAPPGRRPGAGLSTAHPASAPSGVVAEHEPAVPPAPRPPPVSASRCGSGRGGMVVGRVGPRRTQRGEGGPLTGARGRPARPRPRPREPR